MLQAKVRGSALREKELERRVRLSSHLLITDKAYLKDRIWLTATSDLTTGKRHIFHSAFCLDLWKPPYVPLEVIFSVIELKLTEPLKNRENHWSQVNYLKTLLQLKLEIQLHRRKADRPRVERTRVERARSAANHLLNLFSKQRSDKFLLRCSHKIK
ncbi:hypothetical protein ACROYT_G044244 [Oculina patagonica]